MGLHGHETFYRYVLDRRVCHIGGKLGGGKTSLAFRMAYDFVRSGRFRYIFSNVLSVWNDDPAKIGLREGYKVDAVVILDEAGQFMQKDADVREWMRNLRKINCLLLLPTFDPPASTGKLVQIENVYNGYTINLPYYRYKGIMKSTAVKEEISFGWWMPSEIYGIYDTDGFPAESAPKLLEHMEFFRQNAREKLGYGEDASLTTESLDELERETDGVDTDEREESETVPVLEGEKE